MQVVLNEVLLPPCTGYGRWAGRKMDRDELVDIFNAMDSNGLLRQSHLLTGKLAHMSSSTRGGP